MSHKARITDQFGRYYNLKSLQPLNLAELQYLHNDSLTPTAKSGFIGKCVESFKTNFPRIKQWAEDLFFEPVAPQR
ncbi:MAG: hypothetical protein AB7W16_03285 [Candidatus Obscuribacterales bacterium]